MRESQAMEIQTRAAALGSVIVAGLALRLSWVLIPFTQPLVRHFCVCGKFLHW